jgi:hypothetical protein
MNINNPVGSPTSGPASGPVKSSPHLEQVGEQKGPAAVGSSIKTPADSIARSISPPTYVNFSSSERREYSEEADHPVLAQPLEPGKIPVTSPLSPAQQTVVLRFYETKVNEQLQEQGVAENQSNVVLSNLLHEKPISDPKLSTLARSIGRKAAATTAKEMNLPPSWTPKSAKSDDWTVRPMSSYGKEEQQEIDDFYDKTLEQLVTTLIAGAKPPLSPEKIAHLNQAVKTGKVSSDIAEVFVDLTRKATIATQDNFRLPVSWVKGTTDPVDLTPLYSAELNPTAVATAQLEMVVNNMLEIGEEMKVYSDQILADYPEEKKEVQNFYSVFYQSIGAVQDAVDKSKDVNLKVMNENTQAAKSALLDKIANAKHYFEKMLPKQRAQEDKSRRFGFWMKIVGVLLSLVSLVAAIIPPAAAMAVLVVTALFTVYAGLDAGLDLTSKAFQALGDLVTLMMPNASEEAKTAVKLAIVGVMLLVLVASAATAIKMLGTVGTQVATEGATAAAREAAAATTRATVQQAIKQGATQLALLIFSGSGALPESIGLICKSLNLSDEDTQIVQIVVNALALLAVVAAVTYTAKTAPSAPRMPDERSIREIITDYVTKLPATIAQSFKDIFNIKFEGWMEGLKSTLQLTPSLVNIATSSYQGSLLINLSQLLKEIGDNRAADEIMAALVKIFQDMVSKMQNSMGDLADLSADLKTMFDNVVDSQNMAVTNLIRASSRT